MPHDLLSPATLEAIWFTEAQVKLLRALSEASLSTAELMTRGILATTILENQQFGYVEETADARCGSVWSLSEAGWERLRQKW